MNIAVFASGTGTNAEAIIRHLDNPGSPHRVSVVVTNRSGAGVIDRAKNLGVPVEIITRAAMADSDTVGAVLDSYGVEFIALAGYLAMIPQWLVGRYEGRIVNLHPALLPRHGGKGMYGHFVHEAVVAAGDTETGITIHHVDCHYDSGQVIYQESVPVAPTDTPDDVEAAVRALELKRYPKVIASLLDILQTTSSH